MRLVIVDLGMGNLRSVERALLQAASDCNVSVDVFRSNRPDEILSADKIIVPGQGAFRDCAAALEAGLAEPLRQGIRIGKPYFGICLGLQVLFESSEEAPGAKGLGAFQGEVKKLHPGTAPEHVKIPHIGWNQLEIRDRAGIFRAFGQESPYFYFVHSYHAVPKDPTLIVATATHGPNLITAAVCRENVLGVQFHPEKSQTAGLTLLSAFLRG